MNKFTTSTAIPTRALKLEALSNVSASFESFCLASGLEALREMMDHDAQAICGPRHARGRQRRAHRWGKTKGKIGFHGGKVEIERPRLRSFDGKEQLVPSWEAAVAENWLGKWAMNQMLINVATRKFARSVRLPEADVPAPAGAGLSKSAASRRFVALSAARMKDWMTSDLAGLDLLVIQIDGIHMAEDLILVAAIGVDARGDKHPLGLAEGATENAATIQALIDNLVERGLDPAVPRLFIIDGAKALSKAIRRTFGDAAAIQRCQIHKARNIVEHHTMNVKVGYEPRPIGGILSVRVELVPVFCGIGTASRSIAIRDIAQAVDDFDQDVVNNTIEKLTKDLSAEYSVK